MLWRDYPEVDRRLLAIVEEGLKAGRSKNSCFKAFSDQMSAQGINLTPKACEVRYMRLTETVPRRPQKRDKEEEARTPHHGDWKETAVLKIDRMVKGGSTVRAACAKVASEVRRKARTVENAYNDWRKTQPKSQLAPVAAPEVTPAPPQETVKTPAGLVSAGHVRNEEDVLLEAIGKLCEFGPKIKEFDLAAFAGGLSILVRQATLPVAAAQEDEQIAALREQVSNLQQQLAIAEETEGKLRQDNIALRSEMHDVRTEYARYYKEMVERWQEVEEVCSVHLSQSLGERVSFMRPFGERLRLTVDQFGVVLASAPDVLQEHEGLAGRSELPVPETQGGAKGD